MNVAPPLAPTSARACVPSLVTLTGLVLGAFGLAWYPTPGGVTLLALSLACDSLDGFAARRLGACTRFGAAFDFGTDVVLAYAAAVRCSLLFLAHGADMATISAYYATMALGLIGLQTCGLAAFGRRTSGRAFMFALLFTSAALEWWLP